MARKSVGLLMRAFYRRADERALEADRIDLNIDTFQYTVPDAKTLLRNDIVADGVVCTRTKYVM